MNIDNAFELDELVALAKLDIEAGRLEQGLEKLKRAIGLEEVAGEASALLARLYAQLRLFDKAKFYFARFIAANPEAELEIFQLGMTEFDGGNLVEAVNLWGGILERNPTHPPALFYRALAVSEQGLFDEARRDLDVLIKAVAVDNLYFNRAKELLASLDRTTGTERIAASRAAVYGADT